MELYTLRAELSEAFCECSFYDDIKNRSDISINMDTSLFNELNIESIQLLEYILHIEKKINKSIDFDDLSIEDFDTINKLASALVKLV